MFVFKHARRWKLLACHPMRDLNSRPLLVILLRQKKNRRSDGFIRLSSLTRAKPFSRRFWIGDSPFQNGVCRQVRDSMSPQPENVKNFQEVMEAARWAENAAFRAGRCRQRQEKPASKADCAGRIPGPQSNALPDCATARTENQRDSKGYRIEGMAPLQFARKQLGDVRCSIPVASSGGPQISRRPTGRWPPATESSVREPAD